jgi:hypothetical protein
MTSLNLSQQRNNRTLGVGICLNANTLLGDEAEGLQRLTANLGLTDAHGNLLGDEAPATFNLSSRLQKNRLYTNVQSKDADLALSKMDLPQTTDGPISI